MVPGSRSPPVRRDRWSTGNRAATRSSANARVCSPRCLKCARWIARSSVEDQGTMRALASTIVAAAALLACKNHPSKLDDQGTSTGTTDGSASGPTKSTDLPPKPVAVTSKRADPQIHELGMEHVVPTAVMIELATPIVDRDRVGSASGKSVVKVTPEVAGTLTYS